MGMTSLNISFVLYLVVYLPQIFHNRNTHYLAGLSLNMHYILCLSYCLDLFYGFSNHLQWQYKMVSVVSLSVLSFQHLQITHYFWLQKKKIPLYCNLLLLLVAACSIVYFFIIQKASLTSSATQIIGYLSRTGFLMYTIPQIIKNRAIKSADSLSLKFIYLSMSLSLLDMISAWCLDWGWPNKLAAPIMVCLMLILLMQFRRYNTSSPLTQGITPC